jgi:hypothetical protein
VCHAAFKSALDAGATGDLTVRIIVEEDKGDPDYIDEWEMDDMPDLTTETFH